MIGLRELYAATGAMFATFALLGLRDRGNPRRFGTTSFWGLIAISFLAGDRLGDFGNGVLVLGLVTLAGTGALGRGHGVGVGEDRQARATRYGNRLFVPALIVPVGALAGTVLLRHSAFVDPRQVTLVSLGAGVAAALAVGVLWLRPKLLVPLDEGRRLIDAVGWAAVLPQMLAALGAVFVLAHVGDAVGADIGVVIPSGSRVAAVAAYTIGMALLTMALGNAFAAFPVMTAAVGLPLLVRRLGGDPAVVCAIGMLSGFCGTLLTPMAANYNIVPVRLLDLRSQWSVIGAQAPTALPLLAVNALLMLAFAW